MERSRPSPRPSSRDLTVGQTAQLVAEPLDAQGKVLSGRSVAWSSSRPNVATVSATPSHVTRPGDRSLVGR